MERLQPLGREYHRRDGKILATTETDPVEAAEGGGDLILSADVFAQKLLLDPDRFQGQLALTGHDPLECV